MLMNAKAEKESPPHETKLSFSLGFDAQKLSQHSTRSWVRSFWLTVLEFCVALFSSLCFTFDIRTSRLIFPLLFSGNFSRRWILLGIMLGETVPFSFLYTPITSSLECAAYYLVGRKMEDG